VHAGERREGRVSERADMLTHTGLALIAMSFHRLCLGRVAPPASASPGSLPYTIIRSWRNPPSAGRLPLATSALDDAGERRFPFPFPFDPIGNGKRNC
jgi:hypothetical protein